MADDKEQRVIAELQKIAREVPFGEFKVTFKTHQGKISGMKEEHKERTTIIA